MRYMYVYADECIHTCIVKMYVCMYACMRGCGLCMCICMCVHVGRLSEGQQKRFFCIGVKRLRGFLLLARRGETETEEHKAYERSLTVILARSLVSSQVIPSPSPSPSFRWLGFSIFFFLAVSVSLGFVRFVLGFASLHFF